MPEIVSNDTVYISWVQSTLADAGIAALRVPGSFDAAGEMMPQYRLVIAADDWEQARAIIKAALKDAGKSDARPDE